MRVGVVGVNYKLADLKLRELLAKTCHRRFSAGQSTHEYRHFVLLSTCNRTEIYFCSDDLATTHTYLLGILRNDVEEEFDQKLYSYFGYDCFLHLSRVTAGLDSAIVAETEIQGQVKIAYENTIEYTVLPQDLHYLFQKSLQIGKKVRSELPICPGLPGIEHAIFQTGLQTFNNLQIIKVLFVGASEINLKIIQFFQTKGIKNMSLCNRSLDKAQYFASNDQLKILDWNHFNEWPSHDWIILGTKSPKHLITRQNTPSQISQKLIIDLSVPRNVEPEIIHHKSISLFNIDELNSSLASRKERIHDMLSKAEQLVGKSTKQHLDLFHQKSRNRLQVYAATA